MPNITITLTETELKAMEYIAVSPHDWADNAVTNRARTAIDEIVQMYTQKALDEGVQIPMTKDAIIADAYARGWVKTAAQHNEEAQQEAHQNKSSINKTYKQSYRNQSVGLFYYGKSKFKTRVNRLRSS